MAKEKNITKRITTVLKKADKLYQDVERDVKGIMTAVDAVRAVVKDIRDRFKPKDD